MSATLVQHQPYNGSTSRVCWDLPPVASPFHVYYRMNGYQDVDVTGCMPDDITEDEIENLAEKARDYLLSHGE